jgi:K(+)-stimulated pyrophosphate-energized sodium pump
VVGDTVGDPFKDTTSVALNPIIKFSTLFGLLAVEIAVSVKTTAEARGGTDFTPWVGVILFIAALIFVWRSFYAMRIPREERVIPDTETASAPESGEHHVQVGRH